MQFSCDSCKATLHIGDEKVKGKRLVVRCKKCGARIQIADPALGPPPAGAAALSSPGALAPAPTRPPSVRVPVKRPEAPIPDPKPVVKRERDPADTERTQAMDSGVLEQALAASKADDGPLNGAYASSRPPPPPAEADPAIWFAMVAGKQTGPLTRNELGLKVAQAQITPRTYLWKEGMAGWQRAQDVGEISPLLGPVSKPAAAPLSLTIPPPVPASGRQSRPGERELPPQGLGDVPMPAAATGSSPGASADERRGRQRQEPDFARRDLGLDEERTVSNPGSEPLRDKEKDDKQDKPAEKKKPSSLSRAPAPSTQALAASLFAPDEKDSSRDPHSPAPEADDEDRTHVEPLPLGERVHQEAVAKELFPISGEHAPVPGSAKDLASWATQELGRKLPTSPNLPKAPVPTAPPPRPNGSVPLGEASQPTLGGAADPAADPFENIPNAPGFVPPAAVDTTGNIMLRAGVKKNRTPALLAMLFGVVAVLGALLYKLASDQPVLTPEQAQVQKQSLGGTGASVSGLAQANTPESQKIARRPAGAAVNPTATPPAEAVKPAAAAQSGTDAAALAALDNERGIGSHGPKVIDAATTPDTSKGDSGLSPDDIKKKLAENKGALEGCIGDALRKEPNLRVGKIHVATTIAPSGIVTGVKIDKRTVDESALGACLKRATKRIVFPSFTGEEFEVDIPLIVTAGD